MFRTCLLAIALSCIASTTTAHARPLVELDVVDRQRDQTLPEYRHHGDRWIAGVPGHRYAVRLRNNSNQRVLVVLSVDGVNAVSGDTADPSQAGYVLGPWETAQIDGWRKSLRDVAQFVFTDLSDSYAARTGRPDNVGVIGIAVFHERRPLYRYPRPEIARDAQDAAAAPAMPAPRSASKSLAAESADSMARDSVSTTRQRLGTGHGQRQSAPVSRTSFVRASRVPTQVSELRYDGYDRLLAMGVIPRYHHDHDHHPDAFPTSFVPDPPR